MEVKDIFKKLDFNGNGSIDYSEFLIATIDMAVLMTEKKMKEAFNLFDNQNSGIICSEQIKTVLSGNTKQQVEDWEFD